MYVKAKRHFKKVDPLLHRASTEHEIADIVPSDDLFRDIVWTIVGQQLSSLAANAIFARFQKLFVRGRIAPRAVLKLRDKNMRACGLSGAKVRAIRNLAETVQRGELNMKTLHLSEDSIVITELTKVKGIGPWTAEMVLMFSLGRPDIFSKGDLGLRKGVVQLYGLKKFPSEKKLAAITKKWSPYRTYAARILWKVADKNKNRVARKRPGTN
ncbi:MAG TPA: DNA-3-methyladenine glycosylase 2 family protein [Candidatus Paceibacterota bacterium]